MKKRGLGQGLSSLLGVEALTKEGSEGLKEVYTSQLFAGKNQPRRLFNEEEITSLGESIQQNGVLQPILVRKVSDQSYEIIAGERRWRAAKKIGLDRLPVLVREMSDEEVMTVALVENLQRENLNVLEEAQGYDRLLKKMSITQEEVSKLVGKSRSHVANMCRLLQLPEKILGFLEAGDLSAGHAKVLVGVDGCEDLANLIIQKKLNVREAERLVSKTKNKKTEAVEGEVADLLSKTPQKKETRDGADLSLEEKEEIRRIETFLQDRLGYKVDIFINANNSTQVSFYLSSKESLDDFLAKLNTISS